MNIGALQLVNIQPKSNPATQSTQTTATGNGFGDIFNQITTSQNDNVTSLDEALLTEDAINLGQLESLLNATSLEEVFDILEIPHNEGLTNIEVNEKVVALDEVLNSINDLLSSLNVKPEELEQTMKELFEEENLEVNNIWDIIQSINEHASELVNPIVSALNGEHHVTPKAIEKLLHVLKLAQAIGNNTDLLNTQQNQLVQLKEVLKFISNELSTSKEVPQYKQTNKLLFANIVHGQLVQNSNAKKLVSNNEEKAPLLKSNISSITNIGSTNLNQMSQVTEDKTNLLSSEIIKKVTTEEISIVKPERIIVENNKNMLQEVVKRGEVNELNQTNGIVSNSTVTTKTISFTLPVEKSGQSEALAKDIQNLLNRSQISNTQGTMKLLVKLYPENLGSIRIEIFQKNGVLSARLLASTPQAKELLDNQIQQLKSSFAQQNIQMDRIDIAQSLQETDRSNRDQSQFNNLFKQQQSEKEEDEREDQDEEDAISFSDYLLNEEV